ncbi:MAG TPA: alpha/beta fold hydrolase [Candidatus Limnocylindria bacterium]
MRLRNALGMAAVAAIATVSHRYRRDAERALDRLDRFEVGRAETRYGRVEYGMRGDGRPLLVIHGIVGGWDGAPSWHLFEPPGFRGITPARFGYLGSSMPPQSTVELQAEVFRILLDALEISMLPVLAFSAGSTSAVQLALQFPDRVSRLALLCPNSPHPVPVRLPPRWAAPYLFSQPVFWMLKSLAPQVLRRLAGFPPVFAWDARAHADEAQILDSFFPLNLRTRGIVFDAYVSNPAIATLPLEHIAIPTLVVHAADDPLASYDDARAMAERIPGARFRTVPIGGHVFMHRDADAVAEVHEFLSQGA